MKKGMNPTPRDRAAWLFIYESDGCGMEHIRKLFFADITPWAFRVRVSEWFRYGFVAAERIPRVEGIGSGYYLLRLLIKARREVADLYSVDVEDLRKPRQVKRAIPGDHQYYVADFYADLLMGVRKDQRLTLSEVMVDRQLRGRNRDRVPDILFTLQLDHYRPRDFRNEVDRSTNTDPVRMRLRIMIMIEYEHERTVLWTVPDQKRANQIIRWALEVGAKIGLQPDNQWVMIAGQDPLGDVWQVAGQPGVHNLREKLVEN